SVATLSALNDELASQALCVCLALAAFELRLERRQVADARPARSIDRYLNASLVSIAALLALNDPGLGALAVVVLAVFLVQATDRSMALPAATGLAAGVVVAGCCFAATIPPIATAGLVIVTSFAVIEAATVSARGRRSGRSLDCWAVGGLLVPGRR